MVTSRSSGESPFSPLTLEDLGRAVRLGTPEEEAARDLGATLPGDESDTTEQNVSDSTSATTQPS